MQHLRPALTRDYHPSHLCSSAGDSVLLTSRSSWKRSPCSCTARQPPVCSSPCTKRTVLMRLAKISTLHHQ